MSENYIHRVARGSLFVFILTTLGILMSFFLRTYLSKNLSLEYYGLLFGVIAFVGLLDIFREYGLGTAITKFIPEFIYKNERWKIKSSFISFVIIQFIVSIIIFIPVFVFSDYIAITLFKTLEASLLIKFFTFMFFLTSILKPVLSSLDGFQKMATTSSYELIRNFLISISLVFLLPLGLLGVSYAYLISVIGVIIIFSLFYLRTFNDFFKIKAKLSKPLVKKMFLFGAPFYIGAIATAVATQFDTLLITFFHGAEQAGLYNVALPTSKLLWSFAMPLAIVLFPTVSEMWVKNQKELISKGTSLIIKILLIFILPFVVLILSFPELIITTLFDVKFLPAVLTFQILAITTIFYSIFLIGNSIIGGIGKSGKAGKVMTVMSIVTVVLYLGLIPILGIVGAAISVFISSAIAMIMVFRYMKRYIDLKIPYFDILKIFFGSVLVTATIFVTKYMLNMSVWIELFISVFIGFVFYIAYIIYVGCITNEDVKLLSSINVKLPSFAYKIINKLIK